MQRGEIYSIGVELECGFGSNPQENHYTSVERDDYFEELKNKLDFRFGDFVDLSLDGSVNVERTILRSLEIKYWNKSPGKIKQFLDYCYNDLKIKTNSSCGFHIHVKFTNMELWKKIFSSPGFYEDFFKYYKKIWGSNQKYINRLDNGYCIAQYNYANSYSVYGENLPLRIRYDYTQTRYNAINLFSISKHSTIEFRIFPNQTSAKEAYLTIRWLIWIIGKLKKEDIIVDTEQIEVQPTGILLETERNIRKGRLKRNKEIKLKVNKSFEIKKQEMIQDVPIRILCR